MDIQGDFVLTGTVNWVGDSHFLIGGNFVLEGSLISTEGTRSRRRRRLCVASRRIAAERWTGPDPGGGRTPPHL